MTRVTASDRVRRMLSLVPWVAARGEGVAIDELCSRFEIDRKVLLADLEILSFVGVAPYTPDTQVDVVIEDERVWIHLPQWFDRPLRLTPEQGLSLVAAGQSLLDVHGADPGGPLARGIAKVASALGAGDDDTVDVRMGDASSSTVALLQQAIEQARQVRLSYYAYGRDEHTTRVVDPHRLYADQGQWYLAAHCHLAGGDRIFRVDRIGQADVLEQGFTPPREAPSLAVFHPGPDDPRVSLELAPGARWVAEQYPTEQVEELAEGRLLVTLAVAARPWLERLLLRLGPEVRVVRADARLAGAATSGAQRILARYGRPPAGRRPGR